MLNPEPALRAARAIADEAMREFKHAHIDVELADPNDEIEADVFLWLDSDASEEDVQELWTWVRAACERAWRREDVKIVWRKKRNREGTLGRQ